MNDSMRENLSYFGLYMKLFKAKKNVVPEYVSFVGIPQKTVYVNPVVKL